MAPSTCESCRGFASRSQKPSPRERCENSRVLIAITGRITEWGFTPNKSAALGENLVLFVNLAWTAWLYWSIVRGRKRFAKLERWQTDYVPVYAAWAWVVVLAFPPLFAFA